MNRDPIRLPLYLALLALAACRGAPPTAPPEPSPAAPPPAEPAQAPADPQAAAYAARCKEEIAAARAAFEALAGGRGGEALTVLEEFNALQMQLDRTGGLASLYRNVHPNPALREAADRCQQELSALATEIGLSRPLYERLAALDPSGLDAAARRLLTRTLDDFRRAGVNLDAAGRARVQALNAELVELGQRFNRNIREDVRHIELESADRLEGLPQDYIDRHPPGPDGRIRITTDYPDYFPFMQYAADDAARLALYKAFMNRGWPANREVLAQILAKRHALARLLGYPSYAHLVTEDKMIRSPERAQAFINKVNTLAMARAEQDYRILLERLRRIDPGATAVGDWQKMYLEEQVKRERYGLDAQVLRPYFAYARVRDGIFRLVEDLFAVEIRPWTPGPEDPPLWHPSVTAWEVVDGGRVLGRFYLDMHPREGKYKHAAHFTIQTGVAGRRLPMAALVCNFPDPEAGPAYLEHREVETFLHEFGHLLHGIFAGHQRWVAQSGIATEWDFVEAPSQLLEEWIWDAESLRRFAVDDAGRPIPDALVERMNAARRFGRGLFARHQMFYAALSLNYHNRDPAQIDLDGLMIRLRAQYSPFPHVPGTHFYASFGHLVGYSALYYTYMWSLAIAQDMLSVFRDNGMLDRATALRYRKTVLEPGGSRDAEALVQDFLGRPFDFAAFAAWLNRED